ncbi:MAG: hypothetical protein H7289_06325, partial [Mucilaginibacter sp.]|nr:hypothetical protein [Mucilaginibacter sp.]
MLQRSPHGLRDTRIALRNYVPNAIDMKKGLLIFGLMAAAFAATAQVKTAVTQP